MDELGRLREILEKNKDKSFVKRILEKDNYPTLDLGNGNFATHMMSYAESDGKYYAYPTVLYGGGKLTRYQPDEAFRHARETGNYIEFDNEQDADWFTKSYKKVWD